MRVWVVRLNDTILRITTTAEIAHACMKTERESFYTRHVWEEINDDRWWTPAGPHIIWCEPWEVKTSQ